MSRLLRLRFMLYDIANGLHSGLPICCVRSYSIHDRHGMYWTKRGRKASHIIQYVQCARCHRMNHSVAIKHNGMICEWLLPPRAMRFEGE